ncbi:MAG: hypothetical protein ACXACX_13590 [Candidatus Hodarchaeales archaeon]|jgi:hypothetical protein
MVELVQAMLEDFTFLYDLKRKTLNEYISETCPTDKEYSENEVMEITNNEFNKAKQILQKKFLVSFITFLKIRFYYHFKHVRNKLKSNLRYTMINQDNNFVNYLSRI